MIKSWIISKTTSQLNKATFTNLANAILSTVCPIGKVEVFYDNDDHSDYLGFEWERTAIGRVPVGIDTTQTEFNTIGKTGGAKTHTLTVDEMPSHSHNFATRYNADAGAYNVSGVNNTGVQTPGAVTTSNTGGGIAHNNLPPYEVFAIWKRVA